MIKTFDLHRQHTLTNEIHITGKGIHTGMPVEMRLLPAQPDFGIQFRRTDIPGKPVIKANCDSVVDTFRGTTIANRNARVSTTEHLMAAFAGTGIDNCMVEIDEQEIPIMDGSCAPFVEMIEKTGVREQDAPKIWYSLEENLTYHDKENNVKIEAFRDSDYRISSVVDFKSPLLGIQTATLRDMRDFRKEIAPCRTYCLVHELEMLSRNNLVKGDLANNTILLVDQPVTQEQMLAIAGKFNLNPFLPKEGTYLNNLQLHFDNEIARHKLLDMIGDLAMIGFAIRAHVVGHRPGHKANIAFARMIRQQILERKSVAREIA
jgi:UDP-3-O-[3-hydroxymyristoyl] N-acetylglucosamine deacetylase/3-hydroxyacyl-[acyl-carrier-protein] dehydratase